MGGVSSGIPSHTSSLPSGRRSRVKIPVAVVVEIEEIRIILVKSSTRSMKLSTISGHGSFLRRAVELLRIHALPPLAFAIALGKNTVIGHSLERTRFIAAIADRQKLAPHTAGSAVKRNPEPEPLHACDLFHVPTISLFGPILTQFHGWCFE